jgi:HAD superfamily hydrolase (TIGR01484 family)
MGEGRMIDVPNIIVASDLDGTIYKDSEKQIDPKVIGLIDCVSTAGGLFCVCSGRTVNEINNIFSKYLFKKEIAMIGSGGVELSYGGHNYQLSQYSLNEMNKVIEELGHIFLINVYTSDNKYTCLLRDSQSVLKDIVESIIPSYSSHSVNSLMYNFVSRYCYQPFVNSIEKPILKLEIVGNELNVTEEIEKFFKDNNFYFIKTSKYTFDLINNNVNKLTALNLLKKICNCEKFWVMGDYYNDVCLFQNADKAFIESNAPLEIKKYANKIFDFGSWAEIIDDLGELR